MTIDIEIILKDYCAAWCEPDIDKRRAFLENAWSDDGIYQGPSAEAVGPEQLTIDNDDLPQLEILIHRYNDRPMDYADANRLMTGDTASSTALSHASCNCSENYRTSRRQFALSQP